jgi:flavin-dependent dehydrogenase
MYDAIVVGARCAGSPTAMLLARKGYKVLLADKMSFPSDIMSTHYIHPPGVARLAGWGLLDRLHATGCPPITELTVEMGGASLSRPPPPPDAPPPPPAYCPRRTVLDKLLVDAAVEAGAELREKFAVKELTWEGGRVSGIRGETAAEQARIVIGADGMRSVVAKSVQAPEYNTKPSLSFGYYNYWSNVAMNGAEIHFTLDGGALAFPTHDGRYCIAVGGPVELFQEFRKDIPANYWKIIEKIPALHEAMRDARPEERYIGTADQPNFFRRPFGPGWALVGDAGYHRDFITGLGITDAFRDAELLADAIDDGLSGRRPLDEALAGYERRRNEIAEPLYALTIQLLSGEPPSIEQFIAFGAAMQKMMPAGVATA